MPKIWLYCAMLFLTFASGCGGDSRTRVCFSNVDGFCDDVFPGNRAPSADAGDNFTVAVGDTAILDGSDSTDVDGDIVDFAWVQIDGPVVAISEADAERATFVAPSVSAETSLAFRLTVTDNAGLSDTSSVTVTVLPAVAAAASSGIVKLTSIWLPEPLLATDPAAVMPVLPASEQQDFLGYWLLVQLQAFDTGIDTWELDVLLDRLRVISAQSPGRADSAALQLGLAGLQSFSEDRDPAVSAWAGGWLNIGSVVQQEDLELPDVELALNTVRSTGDPVEYARATLRLLRELQTNQN